MKTLDLFQSFFFHQDQNAKAFHGQLAEIISKLVLHFSSDWVQTYVKR